MKLEELINRNYNKLNENDKIICKYIIDNKNNCFKLPIEEFALKCNVSKSTLVRFAKKISLQGFSELKAIIRLEVEERNQKSDSFLEVVIDSYHKMIEDIKDKDCNNIFGYFVKAERIIVYGSGYSQARVASEFKRIFLPTEKIIFSVHGYDMVSTLGEIVTEEDFVIIISLSGESKEVIKLAEKLRIKDIKTLSITRMKNNTLASLCSENLYINSVILPKGKTANYEISTPYFILIEILFLKYQKYLSENQCGHFF